MPITPTTHVVAGLWQKAEANQTRQYLLMYGVTSDSQKGAEDAARALGLAELQQMGQSGYTCVLLNVVTL